MKKWMPRRKRKKSKKNHLKRQQLSLVNKRKIPKLNRGKNRQRITNLVVARTRAEKDIENHSENLTSIFDKHSYFSF
jgi:ubiquinone biosynthesis protein COQ9